VSYSKRDTLNHLNLKIAIPFILLAIGSILAVDTNQALDDVLLRILPFVSFQQPYQPDHLILNLVVLLGLVGELDDGIRPSLS
jgi:hypothetical protein